ncbi:putative ATP-dependent RNA helicase DDX56 [Lycorma delicatula]|uniref:putative ATP-dependent RNA helicase DDX56 n=1 Tax=Lycorma delicatula TaxID=130591 RepID=UPI003F51ABC6
MACEDPKNLEFHEMELDDRILKAIANLGWSHPTLIQERAIPLLLEGKDVLMRARTGTGKTGAFAIPVIQKILYKKQFAREQEVKALILAPSKELCFQIHKNFLQLTSKCSRDVRCVDISPQVDLSVQKAVLVERPDVVISTPARALAHLKANSLTLKDSLEILVIDEADLVFSFGYEDDVKEVLKYMPKIYQAALASATLSDEVITLKKLVLRNAVILKLEEPDLAPVSQLEHFILYAEDNDKAAILYTLLKLQLVRGKTIIFVNTVDKCYKLKLFLEQFRIATCILNSELPANIRCHAVSQFNRGTYDIIIASDEKALEDPVVDCSHQPKSKKRKIDKESGVARGIDFQFVSNVINFDFPLDAASYIHRAGRTARGTNKGTALSFVSVKEVKIKDEVENQLKSSLSENNLFKKYNFKMELVEGFRYRAKDAWRAVTRIAVREARLKEIKQEIINSEKLKGYFEENPRDFISLRHDKALHTVKLQSHLADVPSYLVPEPLKEFAESIPKPKLQHPYQPKKNKFKRRLNALKNNPLFNLQFSGFEESEGSDSKKNKSK